MSAVPGQKNEHRHGSVLVYETSIKARIGIIEKMPKWQHGAHKVLHFAVIGGARKERSRPLPASRIEQAAAGAASAAS